MTTQATFTIRGRNPDVLTCIANLSNDEVFTPPEFANQMLDRVADAWAANHDGANIWADSTVKFLDPFTKSGVFLREITSRLIAGLAAEMPDLALRVDHILTRQVYGIGVTQLTSLLARRSVYCTKWANGEHSIAKSFTSPDGNIWFERTEHTWVGGTHWVYTADETGKRIKKFTNGKCNYCGSSQNTLDRGASRETHAYSFTHTDDVKALIGQVFGEDMQFDVVVGNPPYQLQSDGGTRDIPIYQKFVEQAKKLEPRLLVMVIPSRWMAGGLGLTSFRGEMLGDQHIRRLVDYSRMESVFPGVDFEGGVSYFVWDRDNAGPCEVSFHLGEEQPVTTTRKLDEFDVFVRDSRALPILRKVLAKQEPSITGIMASNNEFGLVTNFKDYRESESPKDNVAVHAIRNNRRVIGWMPRARLPKGDVFVDRWKVLIPKSYGERGTIPAQILGPLLIAAPPSAATQTYVFIDAASEEEANRIAAYSRTRFFRFLLSLRKITQHAAKPVYEWVPVQPWDRDWTDAELNEKYGLTEDEVSYIEKMIRPAATASGEGFPDE